MFSRLASESAPGSVVVMLLGAFHRIILPENISSVIVCVFQLSFFVFYKIVFTARQNGILSFTIYLFLKHYRAVYKFCSDWSMIFLDL